MNEWWIALSAAEKIYFIIALTGSVFLIVQTILTFVGMGGNSGEVDADIDLGDFDGDIGGDVDIDLDTDSALDVVAEGADGADGGFAHTHGEHHSGGISNDPGLRLFTMRGLVAFATIGGWSGFALASTQLHLALTITLSVIFGAAALVLVAYIFKWVLKLQSDGTLQLSNAVGKTGEVYLPIGAENTKTGKIALEVQGRFIEMDAITRGKQNLSVGTGIRVTDMLTDSIAVVESLEPEK